MRQDERIESRIKNALYFAKAIAPPRISVALSSELAEVLDKFMDITGDPQVDISLSKNGKYKIKIEAEASGVKTLNY